LRASFTLCVSADGSRCLRGHVYEGRKGVRAMNLVETRIGGSKTAERVRNKQAKKRPGSALLLPPCSPSVFPQFLPSCPSSLAVSRRTRLSILSVALNDKRHRVNRTGEVPSPFLCSIFPPHTLTLAPSVSGHPTYRRASQRPKDLLSRHSQTSSPSAQLPFLGLSSHFAGRRRKDGRRERLFMAPVCHTRRPRNCLD
jgi:hypothetical protein